MSKTIDALNKVPVKNDVLYEHIADTYFYQRTRHKNLKRKLNSAAKAVRLRFLKTAAILAAVFLLAGVFFYMRANTPEAIRRRFADAPAVSMLEGPALNRDVIKSMRFRGDAVGKSRFLKDSVLLENTKKYRWADLALDLKCPVDLSDRIVSLSLKGSLGGERVNFVIRDMKNRAFRFGGIYLSSAWQAINIDLKKAERDVDLSNISHMRIESGYTGESSKELDSHIDVSIYVKNIRISKER